MRRMRSAGASFLDIERRYGVKRTTAQAAVTGRTWRHVPMPEPEPPWEQLSLPLDSRTIEVA